MRKQDIPKREKRRRLRKILRPLKYVLAAAAIFVGISAFFKISDIQVEGNVIYSDKEIADASGIDTGKSLFLINRRAVRRKIYETLAYVDKVDIRIKAPDTVTVSVDEATVASCVEYDGRWLLLNRSCKVLGTSDSEQMIHIYGLTPQSPREGRVLTVTEEDKDALKCAIELLTLLEEKDMLTGIDWLDLTNRADLRFHYAGSYTVALGTYDRLDYKLEFAHSIMDELGIGEKGIIDLSGETEGHYIPR